MSDFKPISISTSAEFVALCKAQIALLTQGLNAAWSGVYLTEKLTQDAQTKLIPVAVYPETETLSPENTDFTELPELLCNSNSKPLLLNPAKSKDSSPLYLKSSQFNHQCFNNQKQIIVPLIYNEMVLGLLATRHPHRQWNQAELIQIENIAKTIAIACFLNQQQKWYEQQFHLQEEIRKFERNKLHDLLHQLRNPLTAIRTFSKLLLKRLLPDDKNYSIANSMLRETERMQELMQDFSDNLSPIEEIPETKTLSLISSDSLISSTNEKQISVIPENSLPLNSISIEEVLQPLLLSLETIASSQNINFTAHIPDNLPLVKANTKGLREVLNNLIDNALKYTPSGGKVEIMVKPVDEILTIEIADTGYGIPSYDIHRIFERNYRGIQAEGDIQGSGLGLAIAKELIEQMKGSIDLISPNNLLDNLSGTTFIISLSLANS